MSKPGTCRAGRHRLAALAAPAGDLPPQEEKPQGTGHRKLKWLPGERGPVRTNQNGTAVLQRGPGLQTGQAHRGRSPGTELNTKGPGASWPSPQLPGTETDLTPVATLWA